MGNTESINMPCPVEGCDGQITFNAQQLLLGKKFSCPKCDSTIGISNDSNEVALEAMSKFEDLQERLSIKKSK